MNENILKLVADNPNLLKALRDALEAEFGEVMGDANVSNEVLGQQTRARIVGLAAIDTAFRKIVKYKTPESKAEPKNRAR